MEDFLLIKSIGSLITANGTQKYQIKSVLSNSEIIIIDNCIEQLEKYAGLHTLFRMTLENYLDLSRFLDTQENTENINDLNEVSRYTNRFLINYLSSSKMFIEHTEMNIKKLFGDKSFEYKTWKSVTSQEYDTYFSYRFLYQLRNFTQHYGFPVGTITSHLTNKKGQETKVINIFFNKFSLLRSNFNWKKVRTDLENMPSDFSVFKIINEFNGCLARLYQLALGIICKELVLAIPKYLKLLQALKVNSDPMMFTFKDYRDRNNPNKSDTIFRLPYKEVHNCLKDMFDFKVLVDSNDTKQPQEQLK